MTSCVSSNIDDLRDNGHGSYNLRIIIRIITYYSVCTAFVENFRVSEREKNTLSTRTFLNKFPRQQTWAHTWRNTYARCICVTVYVINITQATSCRGESRGLRDAARERGFVRFLIRVLHQQLSVTDQTILVRKVKCDITWQIQLRRVPSREKAL